LGGRKEKGYSEKSGHSAKGQDREDSERPGTGADLKGKSPEKKAREFTPSRWMKPSYLNRDSNKLQVQSQKGKVTGEDKKGRKSLSTWNPRGRGESKTKESFDRIKR